MGNMTRQAVNLVTDAAGDATAYTPQLSGRIVSIRYIKDNFADGVDFTATNETSGEAIWTGTNVNASDVIYPTRTADDNTGVEISNAYVHMVVAQERVKVVVAGGGDSKVGRLEFVIKE